MYTFVSVFNTFITYYFCTIVILAFTVIVMYNEIEYALLSCSQFVETFGLCWLLLTHLPHTVP